VKRMLFLVAVVLAVTGLSIAGHGDYRDEVVYNNFSCSMIQQGHWPKEIASCQK
jgi:hypothetical protein